MSFDASPPAQATFLAVLVTGGRTFDGPRERTIVFQALDRIHQLHEINLIIHGACMKDGRMRGADAVANDWALANEVPMSVWPAKWAKHGNSAGPRRNTMLANALAGTPGYKICVAFPGGRGTSDMLEKCARLQQHNIPVDILQISPEGYGDADVPEQSVVHQLTPK